MGIFGSIGSAISSGVRAIGGAIGSAISGISGALGGALSGTAVGTALGAVTTAIGGLVASIGLPAVVIIAALVGVICGMAVALGLKKEGENEPDEMGMKAEKADKKPEDFDSTEEYIKYLQEEVELTDEEKEKLKNMTPEERAAYQVIGASIYMAGIAEKLGFDENKPIDPNVLYDAASLKLSPKETVTFLKALDTAGLDGKNMSDLLHGKAESLENSSKTQDVVISTIKELDPMLTDDEAFDKLDKMLEGVK